MFLFLETRYCNGKTKTRDQVDLLANEATFLKSLDHEIYAFKNAKNVRISDLSDVFDKNSDVNKKIQSIVLLRGKLRHHSLNSPHRWNPNEQDKYEYAARFISGIVGNIVVEESLSDIYSKKALAMFNELTGKMNLKSEIRMETRRLEKLPAIVLNISIPTTIITSHVCFTAIQKAIEHCASDGQIRDTVNIEANNKNNDLEVFTAELGLWSCTKERNLQLSTSDNSILCTFEHLKSDLIRRDSFSIPHDNSDICIRDGWMLLKQCLNHIDMRDPTTRIMRLKIELNSSHRIVANYKVGAQVRR